MTLLASRTSGAFGIDELLLKHYERFNQQRGSFGCWRRRLLELSPRWEWYSELLLLKKIPTKPLPLINFVDDSDAQARKLIFKLLNHNTSFEDILNSLLHLFGHPGYEKLERLETSFPLEEVIGLNRDIFGDAYSEVMGKCLRTGTGYFPTPQNICNLITDMTLQGCKLTNTVNDPCVGSGRMLLSASNKSIFLSGNDVNLTCVKMTLANGYLFAPWIPIPQPTELLKFNERNINVKNTFSF
jgi:hypothetical protein